MPEDEDPKPDAPGLRLLSVQDVADRTDLSISTIRREIRGKTWILRCRGNLYPEYYQ